MRGLFFEQGQGGFAAVGFHADEAQGFAHGHAQLADALLVVNDQEANSQVFVHTALPMVFSTTEMNCLTPEWFLHAGSAGLAQRGHGFFIGDIAGDEDDAGGQFGAVLRDPGVDVGSVHASGGAHVGDDAQKFS